MFHRSVLTVLSLFLLLTGCKKKAPAPSKQEKPQKQIQISDEKLKKPTTYCEKSFLCSYENLVSDNAKKTVLKKRKAFLQACEEALKNMPAELTAEYEKCVSVPCGDELRKCVLKAGEKIVGTNKKQKRKTVGNSQKAIGKDKTKTSYKPAPAKLKRLPVKLDSVKTKLKPGTKYNGPTP